MIDLDQETERLKVYGTPPYLFWTLIAIVCAFLTIPELLP